MIADALYSITPLQAISTLGVLYLSSLVYKIINFVRVPSHLAHLPTVPLSRTIAFLFSGLGYERYWQQCLKPYFEQHSAVLVHSFTEWQIQFIDAEAARQILYQIDDFPKTDFKDSGIEHGFISKVFGISVVTANGQDWKNNRSVAGQAFHRARPNETIGKVVQHFLDGVEVGKPFLVSAMFRQLTLQVVMRAIFDVQLEKESKDNVPLDKLVCNIMGENNKVGYLMAQPLDRAWFRKEAFQMAEDYDARVMKMIQAKKQQILDKRAKGDVEQTDDDDDTESASKFKGLLELMVEANMDPDMATISDEQVVHNCKTLIVAGHDTTSTALSAITYFLAMHPEVQEKARKEVLAVLRDRHAIPTISQQKNMPYVGAIIREAQRLVPSTATIMNRKTPCAVTLSDGTVLPTGTNVAISIYAMNRDPKRWKNPDVFNPDRHLGDDSEGKGHMDYLTFSAGKRICLGMQLALSELRITLIMLLANYSWTLPADSPHKEMFSMQHIHYVLMPKGLEAVFKKLDN
jgi:cytochrome P450